MSYIKQYCPYRTRYELLQWAKTRYPSTKFDSKWSKKRLFALYYNTK